MSKYWKLLVLAAPLAWIGMPGFPGPGSRADQPDLVVRELFVPFEALNVLLEGQPQRVLLSRQQYESLLAKAKVVPEARAPQAAALLSADYVATVEQERAQLTGTLVVDVLEEGLHALPLDLSGVGLRRATLAGAAAPLGRADDGRLTLFVEGKGRHQLNLEMVAPVETTAAAQVLNLRLPRPPAEISVVTNVLLLLKERDQQARGEFWLSPEVEKLFAFDFEVPAGWDVTSVSTPEGKPLTFERYGPKGEKGRVHVRLPQGIEPGAQYRVYFDAVSTPPDWLGDWPSRQVEFPVFTVIGAARDVGAVASRRCWRSTYIAAPVTGCTRRLSNRPS